MRVVAALVALLMVAGCEAPSKTGEAAKQAAMEVSASDGIDTVGRSGSGFDYRYAFRLQGDKVKPVLQSNADACDKLGPTRCRIIAMRYQVSNSNQIRAVLTLKVDPVIARNYGEAVTKSVTGTGGLLVDTEITGADSTSAARSAAVVSRLRDQLKNAQSAAGSNSPDAAAAKTRVARYETALEAIAEVEASQGASLATAPVLITYESSNALNGLGSADANFRNAGATLEDSLSRVLIVLGSVGPWLLALILIIIVLRWVVHGRGGVMPRDREEEEGYAPAAPAHDDRDDNRNLIQRWFNRDEDRQPEHQ
ncbi:hypothetical protein P1X14_10520 [Sphingomonas sp. AOB5]|uniref:hypothetical protein n=1 Tax=Sphingomonas sp. AOB5 TaxID=3034017 RepID=UPI0023F8D162|nr:hypothetical protein [Sphingomonas sp. AOB5]MDF7775680.1 hypothetical protein [Sphingomonas sp. AOB5]